MLRHCSKQSLSRCCQCNDPQPRIGGGSGLGKMFAMIAAKTRLSWVRLQGEHVAAEAARLARAAVALPRGAPLVHLERGVPLHRLLQAHILLRGAVHLRGGVWGRGAAQLASVRRACARALWGAPQQPPPHLGEMDLLARGRGQLLLAELVPHGGETLAVATPRRIVLYKPLGAIGRSVEFRWHEKEVKGWMRCAARAQSSRAHARCRHW